MPCKCQPPGGQQAGRPVWALWCLLAACLLAGFTASGQAGPLAASTKLPGHPRLLLLEGQEAGIRRLTAADKTWLSLHQAMLAECDRLLDLPPVERIQIGRRLLDKSREALRRIFYLS
ncbi:MAG: hypothetical protein ACO1O1_08345 [Adhaeribacter sp.]